VCVCPPPHTFPLLISVVCFEHFEASLQKYPGHSLMDDLTQTYLRPTFCTDLKNRNLATFMSNVCAAYMYAHSHLLWFERLFWWVHRKTVLLWFNYLTEQSWRGQQETKGHHGLLPETFWHRKRGLSILNSYRLDSSFRFFFLFKAQSFSNMPSWNWHPWSDTQFLISELICAKFNQEEIALQYFFSH